MSMKQRLLMKMGILAFTLSIGVQMANALPPNPSGTGTLAVTAVTVGSVSLTFVTDGSGVTLGGTGTSAASLDFGTVQAYGGTLATNVSETVNGTTSFAVSTPFDVVVGVANFTSSDYTLTAALQSTDPTNQWDLGSGPLSTIAQQLTGAGAYGNTPYTLTLTIPQAAGPQSISNTMNFVATAN
jgi:hypothetical protein